MEGTGFLRMARPAVVAAVTALALTASSAAAQSLTGIRGLGYPIQPTDARTEVLGGLGLGLKGVVAPLTNPAAPAGIARRGVMVAVQATERDVRLGDASDASGATRFPLIQVIYPVGRVVLSVGYGAYLDQAWGVIRSGETVVDDTPLTYTDRIESTGGIGQLQAGVAVPIGQRLAIGAAVGAHTGSQRVELFRLFDTTSVAALDPYSDAFEWEYSGLMAQVGAQLDFGDLARLGASVTWAGSMDADSVAGRVVGRSFDLPLQVAGGASAFLSPGLLAAASVRWSGWSVTEVPENALPLVTGGSAGRDTWEVGGGIEWDASSDASLRSFPLRVGFQYRQLPFALVDEAPNEWLAGAGLGMRLGSDPANPLGLLDLTVQRGARTAPGDATIGDLDERVWRFTLSLSLFGT